MTEASNGIYGVSQADIARAQQERDEALAAQSQEDSSSEKPNPRRQKLLAKKKKKRAELNHAIRERKRRLRIDAKRNRANLSDGEKDKLQEEITALHEKKDKIAEEIAKLENGEPITALGRIGHKVKESIAGLGKINLRDTLSGSNFKEKASRFWDKLKFWKSEDSDEDGDEPADFSTDLTALEQAQNEAQERLQQAQRMIDNLNRSVGTAHFLCSMIENGRITVGNDVDVVKLRAELQTIRNITNNLRGEIGDYHLQVLASAEENMARIMDQLSNEESPQLVFLKDLSRAELLMARIEASPNLEVNIDILNVWRGNINVFHGLVKGGDQQLLAERAAYFQESLATQITQMENILGQGPGKTERVANWAGEQLQKGAELLGVLKEKLANQNPVEMVVNVSQQADRVESRIQKEIDWIYEQRERLFSQYQQLLAETNSSTDPDSNPEKDKKIAEIIQKLDNFQVLETELRANLTKIAVYRERVRLLQRDYQVDPNNEDNRKRIVEEIQQIQEELSDLKPSRSLDRLASRVKEGFSQAGEIVLETVRDRDFRDSVGATGVQVATKLILAPAYVPMAGVVAGRKIYLDETKRRRAVEAGEDVEFLQNKVARRTNREALQENTDNLPVWRQRLRKAVNFATDAFMIFENAGTKIALGHDHKRGRIIAELGNEQGELNPQDIQEWLNNRLEQLQQAKEEANASAIRGILREISVMQRDLTDLALLGEYSPAGFGRHNIEQLTPELVEQMVAILYDPNNRDRLVGAIQDLEQVGSRIASNVRDILKRYDDNYAHERTRNFTSRFIAVNVLTSAAKGVIAAFGVDAYHAVFDKKPEVAAAPTTAEATPTPTDTPAPETPPTPTETAPPGPQDSGVLNSNNPPERPVGPSIEDKVEAGTFNPVEPVPDIDQEVQDFQPSRENLQRVMPRSRPLPEGTSDEIRLGLDPEQNPSIVADNPVVVNGQVEPVIRTDVPGWAVKLNEMGFASPYAYYEGHAADLLDNLTDLPDGFREGAAANLLSNLTPEDHLLSPSQMENIVEYYVQHADDTEKTQLWHALNNLRNGMGGIGNDLSLEQSRQIAQQLLENKVE